MAYQPKLKRTYTMPQFFGVMSSMSRRINKHEILYSVISLVTVEMMNMLVSFKLASKVILHNKSMFQDLFLTANRNSHIASYSKRLSTFPQRVVRPTPIKSDPLFITIPRTTLTLIASNRLRLAYHAEFHTGSLSYVSA